MNELSKILISLRGDDSLRTVKEKTGISHTYWRAMELGKDPRTGNPLQPSPTTLRKISKGYRYPYEKLLAAAGYLDTQAAHIEQSDPFQDLPPEARKSLEEFIKHWNRLHKE